MSAAKSWTGWEEVRRLVATPGQTVMLLATAGGSDRSAAVHAAVAEYEFGDHVHCFLVPIAEEPPSDLGFPAFERPETWTVLIDGFVDRANASMERLWPPPKQKPSRPLIHDALDEPDLRQLRLSVQTRAQRAADPHRFHGADFDWYAVDRNGRVALCSTAGEGEIPSAFVDGCGESLDPILSCQRRLIRVLPERGRAVDEGPGPGGCEEWEALARRGFYAYDWQHWDGPYAKILTPSDPILLSDLPASVIDCMHIVKVDMAFDEDDALEVVGGVARRAQA